MTDDPMGRVEAAVDQAVSTARNMKDDAGEVANNFQRAVDRSVADQPITTIAIALLVGFALGAIWKI
jgi:ElaB/YqjD/DUF883 family membrane-anchored ribosome-binding protein